MEGSRLQQALDALDELNAADPNTVLVDGREWPCELLYGRRMSECLAALEPDASEALQLAVRAQHLERWKIPRDTYPEGRSGYKRWRLDLANLHAERAAEVLQRVGYTEEIIVRVRSMLRKEQLKRDAEVQTLEDAACLVFLQYYFAGFAAKHPREKLVGILRKTWNKMSERGHAAALALDLPEDLAALIGKALEG